MALHPDPALTPQKLRPGLERLFELSAARILALEAAWDPAGGTPVFTVRGRYTSRGWTEWTQGFQFGSALLQFDATGEERFLELGRSRTLERMASHVSHIGVHDHGFNNVSTYGNLRRLMLEGAVSHQPRELETYTLALKVSGAVQAARWSPIHGGGGFIHSFNGPHSLFVDTLRSLRSLALAHQLGHALMGEQDEKISLLARLADHARATARFSIYYGTGRDAYDERGRTAHESLFNPTNGRYRCPATQQGYSPFSTWTRGLAWALCGFAEQLEWFRLFPRLTQSLPGRESLLQAMEQAALATAEFYQAHVSLDGIPLWDTGAPNVHRLAGYTERTSDPYNPWEPVDSSAAAIAAQGLIRLGNHLRATQRKAAGLRLRQAGLTVLRTLLKEPYLATGKKHEGLLLHSVYHRPNGWDPVARGQKVPNGESSMWGDYHLREVALLVLREARGNPCLTFFGPGEPGSGAKPALV